MRDWQMQRKPKLSVDQDERAEDEVFPGWKSTSSTHPRLTLPSVPKIAATPAQRPTAPHPASSVPASPHAPTAPRMPASSPTSPRAPTAPRMPTTTSGRRFIPRPSTAHPSAPIPTQPPGKPAGRLQTGTRLPAPSGAWLDDESPARFQTSKRLPTPSRAWDNEEPEEPAPAAQSVMLIPGKYPGARSQRSWLGRTRQNIPARLQAIILLCILSALVLGVVLGGVLKGGLELSALNFSPSSAGSALLPVPTAGPTLPAGVNTTDVNYYVTKYGFDAPSNVPALDSGEQQRLAKMLPYAMAATARYDARYGARVEPEMLLWWTHAEGIGARVNYSNCANESPAAGQSFFSDIENCDRPDFWQLGYGNQFGNIWVLKDAFTDMYGNPNDPALVQKVGQSVLDYDASQHTVPTCGGYSCTFPSLTIDQIMADVHWHASDHKETESNWWASVLSRDPAINSYMLALALTSFSHAQTKTWVGCYYAEPCWQSESNAMWQILDAWKSLGG